jgi:hypothetical protein
MIAVCGLVLTTFDANGTTINVVGLTLTLDQWPLRCALAPVFALAMLSVFAALDAAPGSASRPYLFAPLVGLWASATASLICIVIVLVLGPPADAGRWLSTDPGPTTALALSLLAYFCCASYFHLWPLVLPERRTPRAAYRWCISMAVGAVPVLTLTCAAILSFARPPLSV